MASGDHAVATQDIVEVDMDRYEKLKGITREKVMDLLKIKVDGRGKYRDKLFLIQTNFNPIHVDSKKARTRHDIVAKHLFEFKLYRIASTPGQRCTNSRGTYLCYINCERSGHRKKVKDLCMKIKQKLLNRESRTNISRAHVVASLVTYYGEDEDD